MILSLTGVPLPLRLKPETPMSDEELMCFCAANEVLRVERDVNGEILVMSPAGSKTSKMNMRIGRFLDEWAESDGNGVAFDSNGGFTLPDGSMRAADAAWLQRERWESLSSEDQSRFAPICPDFVIELRSQTDRLSDLQTKMQQWIANGAQLAWLIDPVEQSVTIYRQGQEPERHRHPIAVRGDGIMTGFELVMTRIWQ